MRMWMMALVTINSLATTQAQAFSTGPVIVTAILPTNYGIVYLIHAGTREKIPTCGAAFNNRLAFNVTTPAGQAMLSTLLTAFATHKSVTFTGSGNCDATSSDTESVNYFYVAG